MKKAFTKKHLHNIFLEMEPRTAAYGERLWLGDLAGSWHAAHHRSEFRHIIYMSSDKL